MPPAIRYISTTTETLNLDIKCDLSTGLPLLEEADNILRLVLTYLPLPYSVAEYGCGKKASIILKKLVDFGIPAYALKRGMILEKDMSDAALAETDYTRRPHALIVENPLYFKTDLQQATLLHMLDRNHTTVHIDRKEIHAGEYVLSHDHYLQFVKARSHIYVIIVFWDGSGNRPVERVIDPTLDRRRLFDVARMRHYLRSREALLLGAPLLGSFRLEAPLLTAAHHEELRTLLDSVSPDVLSAEQRAGVIRQLAGASPGTIGDPETWTYANNHVDPNSTHDGQQKRRSGTGELLRDGLRRMLDLRSECREEVIEVREELKSAVQSLDLAGVLKEDADWSERQLAPLADVAGTISYHETIAHLAEEIRKDRPLLRDLSGDDDVEVLWGMGVSLRRRIEETAVVSRDDSDIIDARAFNGQFVRAAVLVIQQMNRAGLRVFIDRVGNIHGLLLSDDSCEAVRSGRLRLPELTRRALCLCSHIDTVRDAGKYDGRLGVLAGIEIAHTLNDLEHFFDIPAGDPAAPRVLMVSAFVGEEMTYTGEGVSMPGSAAVAGLASPEQIQRMRNGDGDTFLSGLDNFLIRLKAACRDGRIDLMNDFAGTPDTELRSACFAPRNFFTPCTYERHIEQGPVLDQQSIPLVQIDRVMGIHQEDLLIEGERAEAAALEINYRLRECVINGDYDDIRVTVGIIEPQPEDPARDQTDIAFRCALDGEKNHAGATPMNERRDPGVAAGRLMRHFFSEVMTLNRKTNRGLHACVGGVNLSPGTDRNVIPERAVLTLGIRNGSLSEAEHLHITRSLHHLLINTLSQSVAAGGEGVRMCSVEPIDYLTISRRVRLAVDLRAAAQPEIERFREDMQAVLAETGEAFAVTIAAAVQQMVPPSALSETGQILQIERSYGGSHNRNEAELAEDLLRGGILQFAVTHHFLRHIPANPRDLYRLVKDQLPGDWQIPFVSGALHDTCNIAAAARRTENTENQDNISY